jgi:hypothetical protein
MPPKPKAKRTRKERAAANAAAPRASRKHALPVTARLVEHLREQTDEYADGRLELTDADRLAIALQLLASNVVVAADQGLDGGDTALTLLANIEAFARGVLDAAHGGA